MLRLAEEAGSASADEEEHFGLGENNGEEDLLLALAMQLTPSQAGAPRASVVEASLGGFQERNTTHALPFPSGLTLPVAPLSQNQLPCSIFPGNPSQTETYRRAQAALEQFLAATQRECEEILECSAQEERKSGSDDVMEESDGADDEDLITDDESGDALDPVDDDNAQAQHAEQAFPLPKPPPPIVPPPPPPRFNPCDEPRIPQVDGGFDDDVIFISNPTQTPKYESQSDLIQDGDVDNGTAQATPDGLSLDQNPEPHSSRNPNTDPSIKDDVINIQNTTRQFPPPLPLSSRPLGSTAGVPARVSGLRRLRPPALPVPAAAPTIEAPNEDLVMLLEPVKNIPALEESIGNGATKQEKAAIEQIAAAPSSLPPAQQTLPSSAAYVPRKQVRASSQTLAAAMRLLAPPESSDDEEEKKLIVLEPEESLPSAQVVFKTIDTSREMINVPARSPPPFSQEQSVHSGSLPPTQPLESPMIEDSPFSKKDEDKVTSNNPNTTQIEHAQHPLAQSPPDMAILADEATDVNAESAILEAKKGFSREELQSEPMEIDREPASQGEDAEMAPAVAPTSAPISVPSEPNEFALAASNAAWWREDVSQIPFNDLEWDLLDAEADADGADGVWEHHFGSGGLAQVFEAHESEEEQNPDAQGEVVSEDKDLPSGILRVHRFRRPPPSQAQLLASGWDAGILPVVHPAPHYSNPAHVPRKAPVFAGKEFRVPCTAVQELAAFGSAMEQAQALAFATNRYNLAARRSVLFAFAPARRPPSRAETDAWLAAEASRLSRGRRRLGPTGAAGFRMDPNTGKMVPTGRDTPEGVPSPSPASDSAGISGAGDLLATPSLASIFSSGGKGASTQQRTPSFGAVKPGSSSRGTPEDRVLQADGFAQAPQVTSPREEVRPASPKYDERSFFYNNPFI